MSDGMFSRNAMTGLLRRHGGHLLMLAVMLAGSGALAWARHDVSAQVAEAEEAARPGDIVITTVYAEDCTLCFDAGAVADHIAAGPVKVTERRAVEYGTSEGAALMAKYHLTKIPAVVVTGETDKTNVEAYLKDDTRVAADGRVWAEMPPVYIDVASGEMRGVVALTVIDDAACDDCYDPAVHAAVLRNNFGMTVGDERTLDVDDDDARALIDAYGITSVPTVIISSDAAAYRDFVNAFMSVGDVADDSSFIFRNVGIFGSYVDLETGSVVDPTATDDNNQ